MTSVSDAVLPDEAERFLRGLDRALSPLPGEERQEIVDEVRSHLADRAAQGATDLLGGFGSPDAYGAAFLQEKALASALARGTSWAIGRALLAGARKVGWWYVVAVLGLLHLFGVSFLVLAVLKPVFPGNVGLFMGGGRFSLGAIFGGEVGNTTEVLGWWSIPVFAVLGASALWGGNWMLRALGRWRLARLRATGGR